MHYDNRDNENNSTKVLEMLLDLPMLGTTVEFAILMAAHHLLRQDSRNLGIGHNQIWVKADKVDIKFSMIKDNVTMQRTLGKYSTVIPTREECGRNLPD